MAPVDTAEELAELNAVLRQLRPPWLLRVYEAEAAVYEEITDEDVKCEFIDGAMILHSPASLCHEERTSFIGSLLREFVTDRGLGQVFGSNAVMQLGQRRFSPDASVLKAEHTDRVRGGRAFGPMDLVVEVMSASTRDYDHRTKLPAYREGRVPEIWYVDAERRQFEAHALRDEDYSVTALATGRYESLALPGFRLDVDWLWRDPLPPVSACRMDG